MSIKYQRELDNERYALLPDKRILIEKSMFLQISDYTRSQPTSPSPGRIYRKNLGWPNDMPDNWFVYFCERDPADEAYVLHHPYRVELVEDSL
jgi:hypothetical protein